MHFIFGYQKEVPVKIEGKTSKIALLLLGILVVLLFIFLTFENLDKDPSISPSIFEKPPSLDKPNQSAQLEEIKFEKAGLHENAGLSFCKTADAVTNQGGLK
jgi:hypothetical protein